MKSVQFMLLTIAVLGGWLVNADSVSAQTWTQTSAPNISWQAIASSADGVKLVAVKPYIPAIYTSTNSGTSWISNNAPSIEWWSVASSADGTHLIAAASYDLNGIYTSTNSGATWVSNNVPRNAWFSVVSSADGTKLIAVAGGGQLIGPIYTSSDSGVTWTSNNLAVDHWYSVACSADGSKLVAGDTSGKIFTSTDSGITWTQPSSLSGVVYSLASSVDGSRLIAGCSVSGVGIVYTSMDSGNSWVSNNLSLGNSGLLSVSSSADGTKLVVASQTKGIYSSIDSGATWISDNAPNQVWEAVASSADENRLAVCTVKSSPGGIWISQTTPTPQLNIAPTDSNLKLSWLVPSTNFVLQQSSDLSSWSDVTNPPALNLANLQDEVVLSPTNSGGFYRLESR
ncbi:MAG TPA: hypothetical protein VHG71_13495 [Verrucomicrobiae bacterium]|nr:hypothetical protein [Verrucomicrobiae bacterium]